MNDELHTLAETRPSLRVVPEATTHVDPSWKRTDCDEPPDDPFADTAPTRSSEGHGPIGDEEFWTSRPSLQRIFDCALSRMCSPWAVLGVVICRVNATIPPGVQLPAIIGTEASLNLHLALVGESGGGKGAARGCAMDTVRLDDSDVHWTQPGSGEGLAKAFVHSERDPANPGKFCMVQDRTSVIFYSSEVDTMTALGNRSGATLDPMLRAMFSGEALGFQNASPDRTLNVAEHAYRAMLIVGVQPARAQKLMDAVGGGTPQRFLWMPTTDPRITATPPAWPGGLHVERQRWHTPHTLHVPDVAATAIREASAARNRGEGDALDGHGLLVREKVAAALCVLDSRRTMTEEDWRLAGLVMAASDRCRRTVTLRIQQARDDADVTRGRSEGRRAEAAQDYRDKQATTRVAKFLMRKLRTVGEAGMSSGDLRRALPSRDRSYFESATEHLLAVGAMTSVPSGDGERFYAAKDAA